MNIITPASIISFLIVSIVIAIISLCLLNKKKHDISIEVYLDNISVNITQIIEDMLTQYAYADRLFFDLLSDRVTNFIYYELKLDPGYYHIINSNTIRSYVKFIYTDYYEEKTKAIKNEIE